VIVATIAGARWRLWPNGHPVVRLASGRDLDVAAMASDPAGRRLHRRGSRPTSVAARYARLQVLARARRAEKVELVRRAGLRPGMRCLDLGCGGGAVTFELASLAGSAGAVTGMDMDDAPLALARETARECGIANVEFRAANVNDWDEPSGYDFVYCRFLLQHLSRPAGLLRRMWSAVRPGGPIAVEDTDFDGFFCDPKTTGSTSTSRCIRGSVSTMGAMSGSGASSTGISCRPASPIPACIWCRASAPPVRPRR
jgi:SAM-dependent methyltransferase